MESNIDMEQDKKDNALILKLVGRLDAVTAPDIEKTVKKLVCSTSLVQTSEVHTFVFNIPGFGVVIIIVITNTTNYSQICEDDGQPEPTGGVGGSS